MMTRMRTTSLAIFVTLLSLTMVGEGMITVTLVWTSAGMGQSPLFIGIVLFIMNIVPFLAQILFKPMRRAIEQHPLGMIIMPRMIGCVVASLAGMTLDASSLITLIAIAACLTFISFISQQCIETLMGQLTVTGMLDAGTSARLSQTALQSGVFVGNALAGFLIAKSGTGLVFFGIASVLPAASCFCTLRHGYGWVRNPLRQPARAMQPCRCSGMRQSARCGRYLQEWLCWPFSSVVSTSLSR